MSENDSLSFALRCVKAQALREAVEALEDVDPDDIREWLTARADALEKP